MPDGSVIITVKADDKNAQKTLNSLNKDINKLQAKLNKGEAARSPIVAQLQEAQKQAIAAYTEIEKLQKDLAKSQLMTSKDYNGFINAEEFIQQLALQEKIKSEIQQQTTLMNAAEKEAQRLEAQDRKIVAAKQRDSLKRKRSRRDRSSRT